MRLYQAAKQMNLKAHILLKILKELKFGYNSVNNELKHSFDELKLVVEKHGNDQRDTKAKIEEQTKAVLLGIVLDPKTNKYSRVLLKLDINEIKKIDCDVTILGEHNTIHGAKLEVFKDMQKNLLTNSKDYE